MKLQIKKMIVLWVAIRLMIFLALPAASATPITYTDVTCLNVDWGCSSSLYLYYLNGTLAGRLNTTGDTINVDGTIPIQILLKPSSASLANNPYVILPWVLNMFQALIVIVFVFAIPISTFYIIRRLFIGKDPVQQQGWGNGWGKRKWR